MFIFKRVILFSRKSKSKRIAVTRAGVRPSIDEGDGGLFTVCHEEEFFSLNANFQNVLLQTELLLTPCPRSATHRGWVFVGEGFKNNIFVCNYPRLPRLLSQDACHFLGSRGNQSITRNDDRFQK